MISAGSDLEACREAIRHGSLSFYSASRLLPKHVRDPALALYAFCRLADDAVDLQKEKAAAVLRLQDRLDKIYEGYPDDSYADRAFARVIDTFDMPRALPDALLEGLAWDAMGKQYDNLSGVFDYSARVAAAVGVMMCVLMRVRDPDALARACDMGVAMQLTNIARDVGEDALEGRLYLPKDWLKEAGVTPESFLQDPRPTKAVRQMVRRLLMHANRLYLRSEAGIAELPATARPGILAARFIYAGIGSEVQRAGYDSMTSRARTSKAQKLGWLFHAGAKSVTTFIMPRSAVLYAPCLPETQFLVDAVAMRKDAPTRLDNVLDTLVGIAARQRIETQNLMGDQVRSS